MGNDNGKEKLSLIFHAHPIIGKVVKIASVHPYLSNVMVIPVKDARRELFN
jgi:hypothetical protein